MTHTPTQLNVADRLALVGFYYRQPRNQQGIVRTDLYEMGTDKPVTTFRNVFEAIEFLERIGG